MDPGYQIFNNDDELVTNSGKDESQEVGIEVDNVALVNTGKET